mgnify:CR=1
MRARATIRLASTLDVVTYMLEVQARLDMGSALFVSLNENSHY